MLFYCISESAVNTDTGFLQEFIDAGFDEVRIVSEAPDKQENSISYAELSDQWDAFMQEEQQLYFMNHMLSEPLSCLTDLFRFMEKDDALRILCDARDVYGQDKLPDSWFYEGTAKENMPLLLSFSSRSTSSRICKALFVAAAGLQNVFSSLTEQHQDAAADETYFHYWQRQHMPQWDTPVPYGVSVTDYLIHGFPFAYLGIFRMHRRILVRYGTDNRPSVLLEMLKKDGRILPCAEKFLFGSCDAAFLKDTLQLNVILPEIQHPSPRKLQDCAVFAHLYYERDFEKNLRYLQAAANYCDVYISVDSEEKQQKVLALAEEPLRSNMQVITVQNRGRDLSALLVGFRPYALRYPYFCFVHDKRSHANEVETVGAAFHACIWDNLIGNGSVLPQMRDYFEKHSSVGLLVPPPPYWGGYMQTKSNFWTICYDKTASLAKELGLHSTVRRDINPVALGTAFWCRREALIPLLKRQWQYEDFDPEPLGIDGTFSHALERIFPYAALDQHYLTGWMMTDNFTSGLLESHVYILDHVLGRADQLHVTALLQDEENFEIGARLSFTLTLKMAGVFWKSLVRFVKKKLKCF